MDMSAMWPCDHVTMWYEICVCKDCCIILHSMFITAILINQLINAYWLFKLLEKFKVYENLYKWNALFLLLFVPITRVWWKCLSLLESTERNRKNECRLINFIVKCPAPVTFHLRCLKHFTSRMFCWCGYRNILHWYRWDENYKSSALVDEVIWRWCL